MKPHTPGPWRIGKNGGVVADHAVPEIGGSGDVAYYGGHLIAESIAPQNQALIAAAPEMLDVLKTIENDGKQVPDWLWDRIQAVIAKTRPTTNPAPLTQLGNTGPGSDARPGPDLTPAGGGK